MPNEISVEELKPVRDVLFDKSKFSGAQLARLIGTDNNSLWMDFNKRGLGPADARSIAAVVDDWSKELKRVAVTLRQIAQSVTAKNLAADIDAANKRRTNKQ